jgi:cation transport ATPase
MQNAKCKMQKKKQKQNAKEKAKAKANQTKTKIIKILAPPLPTCTLLLLNMASVDEIAQESEYQAMVADVVCTLCMIYYFIPFIYLLFYFSEWSVLSWDQ